VRRRITFGRCRAADRGGADLALGKKTFADNCAACHGDDGKGNKEMGAPNLTTKVWLYGPELSTSSTGSGRRRRSDAGLGLKLNGEEIKALTVFRPQSRRGQ